MDRDGLINRKAEPHRYITRRDDLVILPGVHEAIRSLNEAGYLVIVVTNQRGIAKGMMSMEDVKDLHDYLLEELAKKGAHIDGFYVCPHDVGQCNCRKPDIGLFLMAEEDFPIEKNGSWMIGDSESDVYAGERYGVRTLLTDDLRGATSIILSNRLNEIQ